MNYRTLACLIVSFLLTGCPTSTTLSLDAGGVDAEEDRGSPDAAPGPDAFVTPDAFVDVDAARFAVDLILRSDTASAYEGQTIQIRLLDTSVGTSSAWFTVVVTGGRFELTIPNGFDRDLFGMVALLYVDVDGDAQCDAGIEDAFQHVANNDFGTGAEESTITFAPMDTTITCDDAMNR